MNQSLRPKQEAFVQFKWFLTLAGALLVLACVYLGSRVFYQGPMPAYLMAGLGVVVAVVWSFLWVELSHSYQKAEFLFQDDRLIVRGGGIFSNFEQELVAKNITHVILRKPFLEYRFHKTGHIYIQAAGGADVEVHMRSIEAPESVFQQVLALMRNNGFALTCEDQVYEARPAQRGVLLQTLFFIGIGAFVLLGVVSGFMEDQAKGKMKLVFGWEAFVLAAIVILGAIGTIVYFHGWMSRRRYTLYEDAITSETDFFSTEQVIIPMENLSDSTLSQNFLGRLIGISDLALSCQGSGHEIKFSFIDQGQLWKENLDTLIQQRTQRKRQAAAAAAAVASGPSVKDWQQPKRPAIERDETTTTSLHMHHKRLFLIPAIALGVGIALFVLGSILAQGIQGGKNPNPSQIFGLVVLALGGLMAFGGGIRLIYGFILVRSHTYEIKPTGFARYFRFIITKDVIFQAEKVTAVIVREGLVDRMFGTCSIDFWSIGASDHLRYSFIPKDEDTLRLILAKTGIHPKDGAKHREVLSQADPLRVMQMGMFVLLPLLLAIPILWLFVHPLAAVGAFLLIVLLIAGANIYYRFHKLTLYEDYLWFRKGIITHTHYYVLYQDVKYVQSNLYPTTSAGTLRFEITGERVVKTNNGEIKLSNRFYVRFVPDVRFHHLLMDLLLDRKIDWDRLPQSPTTMDEFKPRELASSGPKMSQELLTRGLGVVLVVIIAVAVGLFMMTQNEQQQLKVVGFYLIVGMSLLGLLQSVVVVLYVRSIRYLLDEQKVSKVWGIIFRSQMGIHYQDIDYIGKKYGMIHKIFGTGNVTINTVGSSTTDLTLTNLPDTERFYELLKQRYQGKTETQVSNPRGN